MKVWIIKAGGELLHLHQVRKKIIKDLSRLYKSRNIIFVHGGGPQIKRALGKKGIHLPFVRGRRVTTPRAMKIVEKVLSGTLNKSIAGQLKRNHVPSIGLSGRDGMILQGQPIPGLKRAASPKKINPELLLRFLELKFLPVLSSVGSDRKGRAVNINADDAASALAVKLKAERLIFLTQTKGVLNADKKSIPRLKIKDVNKLIKKGIITGGMIPKVQSSCQAIKKGVGEVDILLGKKGIKFDQGTRILK